MKPFLLFLLVALSLPVYSHNDFDLRLSDTLDESQMGLWQQGDYRIYVPMDGLEARYRQAGNTFLEAAKNNGFTDSTNNLYYVVAQRYFVVADQLKNAPNGFDLRTLALYYGPDDEKQNEGNSHMIEYDVRAILETGRAAVFKNGQRIYFLKRHYEPSDVGISAFTTTLYYDNVNDFIFKYTTDYGW